MEPNVDRGMWAVLALLIAVGIGSITVIAFPAIVEDITNLMTLSSDEALKDFGIISANENLIKYSDSLIFDGSNGYRVREFDQAIGEYTVSFDYDITDMAVDFSNFILWSEKTDKLITLIPHEVGSLTGHTSQTFKLDHNPGNIFIYLGDSWQTSNKNKGFINKLKVEKGPVETDWILSK